MSYFLSPALVQLRNEINSLWPGRDRASDGWIGDAAHNARKSDHNPDYASGGIVRAIDVDKDGIPADSVVDQIRRDPRTAYVIWNARIWENPSAYPGRGYWRAYTGANAHRQHFHVSVRHGARWDRDASPWHLTRSLSGGTTIGGALPTIDIDPITGIARKEEEDMARQTIITQGDQWAITDGITKRVLTGQGDIRALLDLGLVDQATADRAVAGGLWVTPQMWAAIPSVS